MESYLKKLININTLIFDVDGVLTNGSLLATNTGELLRTMYIRDGFALQLAVKKGYNVAIITGGKSTGIIKRFEYLGIKDVFLGIAKKIETFKKYINDKKVGSDQVLYMGDDLPDYEVMKIVGLPVCPSDASVEIKNLSLYVAHKKGGEGCVREVIEMVLKSQNKWMQDGDIEW